MPATQPRPRPLPLLYDRDAGIRAGSNADELVARQDVGTGSIDGSSSAAGNTTPAASSSPSSASASASLNEPSSSASSSSPEASSSSGGNPLGSIISGLTGQSSSSSSPSASSNPAPSPSSSASDPTRSSSQSQTSSAPPSSSTQVFTSTSMDSTGGVVIATITSVVQASPSGTVIDGGSSTGNDSRGSSGSSSNIGAIVGGVVGGVAGLIAIVWLILLPLRRRQKRKKEVEWLAFGQENDHTNQSSADAVFGRPTSSSGVHKDDERDETGGNVMAMLEVGDARRSMDAQQAGEMGVGGTVYPNTAPYRYQSLDGPASTQWGPGGYGDPNYVDPQYAAYYAQQQGYEYDPHMANQYMQSHPQAPQQYQNAPWAQQQQAYGSAAGSAAGLAHNRSAGSQSAVSSAPTRVQSSTGYNPTLPQEKQDALARNASASAYSTASHPQSSSPILGPQQAKDHAHTDVAAPDPNARSGSPVSATSLHGGPGLHLVNPEQASIDEENDR